MMQNWLKNRHNIKKKFNQKQRKLQNNVQYDKRKVKINSEKRVKSATKAFRNQ